MRGMVSEHKNCIELHELLRGLSHPGPLNNHEVQLAVLKAPVLLDLQSSRIEYKHL